MSKIKEWLTARGISYDLAMEVGVKSDPEETKLAYPRVGKDHDPVGWKIRSIETGAQFNYPGGIPVSETIPFTTAQGKEAAVLCEGETDSLRLATEATAHDWEIMCVPGSSSFPASWAGYLAKWDRVYVIPDGDKPGEGMARKVCSLVPRARYVKLPDGLDLSDYLNEYTLKDLLELVLEAQPMDTHKMKLRHDRYESPIDIDAHKLVDLVLLDTRLKRRGKEFVGKCPFHKEKTPSFMVDPKKGLYYCHGCHRGGDAIKYLQELHGLSWGEAIKKVKDCP